MSECFVFYFYNEDVARAHTLKRVTVEDDEIRFLLGADNECVVRRPGKIEITDEKIEIDTADSIVWKGYVEREDHVPENLLIREYRKVEDDRIRTTVTGYYQSESEREAKSAKALIAFGRAKADEPSLEETKYLFFLCDGSSFAAAWDLGLKIPRELENEWREEIKANLLAKIAETDGNERIATVKRYCDLLKEDEAARYIAAFAEEKRLEPEEIEELTAYREGRVKRGERIKRAFISDTVDAAPAGFVSYPVAALIGRRYETRLESNVRVYAPAGTDFNEVWYAFSVGRVGFLDLGLIRYRKMMDCCLSLLYQPFFDDLYRQIKNAIGGIPKRKRKTIEKKILRFYVDPKRLAIVKLLTERGAPVAGYDFFEEHGVYEKSKELLDLIRAAR